MAQSLGQAFACSLKENSIRVLQGKVARACNLISSVLVSGKNTAKLGKSCSLFPGKMLVQVGERVRNEYLLSMEQSGKEGPYPIYSHLPLGYLLGHNPAGLEAPQCVLMQCMPVLSTLKLNGMRQWILPESKIW